LFRPSLLSLFLGGFLSIASANLRLKAGSSVGLFSAHSPIKALQLLVAQKDKIFPNLPRAILKELPEGGCGRG
jgi:hypothetical protein